MHSEGKESKKDRKVAQWLTLDPTWQLIQFFANLLWSRELSACVHQSASLTIITQSSDRGWDSAWHRITAWSWHELFNRGKGNNEFWESKGKSIKRVHSLWKYELIPILSAWILALKLVWHFVFCYLSRYSEWETLLDTTKSFLRPGPPRCPWICVASRSVNVCGPLPLIRAIVWIWIHFDTLDTSFIFIFLS